MDDRITSMTTDQALHALLLFYDLLPHEMWEDQTKPSLARMEALSDRLQKNAPNEIKPVINSLLAEGNLDSKGKLAKVLLYTFSQQDALRPYVEQAVAHSAEPHMAPIPMDIGPVLIALALLSFDMDLQTKRLKLHIKSRVPEVVEKFTGLVKALPSELLGRFK
jgi:hypothetical protein